VLAPTLAGVYWWERKIPRTILSSQEPKQSTGPG